MNPEWDVKKPAIALIVIAVLNAFLLLRLMQVTLGGIGSGDFFHTPWMEVLFFGIPALIGDIKRLQQPLVVFFLKTGMLFSLLTFYGAAHMMAGLRRNLSGLAALMVMVPIFSPLALAGIPVGIWTFYTLNRKDVKDYFESNKPDSGDPNTSRPEPDREARQQV